MLLTCPVRYSWQRHVLARVCLNAISATVSNDSRLCEEELDIVHGASDDGKGELVTVLERPLPSCLLAVATCR